MLCITSPKINRAFLGRLYLDTTGCGTDLSMNTNNSSLIYQGYVGETGSDGEEGYHGDVVGY